MLLVDGPNAITLRGLGIKDKHCVFINENDNVYIQPYNAKDFAHTLVNGEHIILKKQLQHGDRVIIGQNHIFRFSARDSVRQASTQDLSAVKVLSGFTNIYLVQSRAASHMANVLCSLTRPWTAYRPICDES